ncbi:MAG TPA: ATP phosphoribosyltransferase regulatory subunit [Galbitalea sp.]|nr:ATP phosphoribosyltransferase regulatory subunit [Galbitalea sp.]
MRDFLPPEKARREHVLSIIRQTFRSHGFDEIETPVVEDSDRLHSGLGGDNEKLSFAVMKRDLKLAALEAAASSGDPLELADLGLRFDLTVPLARFYATHRAELPRVFRSIQIAPVWRAERPQKGRFRQFVQCDIDVIGDDTQLAEVELITATMAALDALGLSGCSIRINDRRILRALVESLGIAPEHYEGALITIDKEDKVGVSGVVKELVDRGLATVDTASVVEAQLHELSRLENDGWSLLEGPDAPPAWLDQPAYVDLLAIRTAVAASGSDAKLVFAPNLVRGMGYYTGTIFEIAHPSVDYSLGGGGRYDGMIGRFLGTDVPAAGFSLGFERIVDLVELPDDGATNSVALLFDDGVPASQVTALKAELIASGARVTVAARAKNSKQQLDQLAASGYSKFAFVTNETRSLSASDLRPLGAQ